MEKPWSEACERNWQPILNVLERYLRSPASLLEIGSGTGQHAVRFARALPQVRWQATERAGLLPGLALWVEEACLPNLPAPLALDVCDEPWPVVDFDHVFTANTLHIMSWPEVCCLFQGVGRGLTAGGRLLVYGPFMRAGLHTAASNARFDAWLRARDPASGVRDLDELEKLASSHALFLHRIHAMPANNLLLVWQKGE